MMRSFIIYRLIDYCIERLATEIEYKICGIPYWDIVIGGEYLYMIATDDSGKVCKHHNVTVTSIGCFSLQSF